MKEEYRKKSEELLGLIKSNSNFNVLWVPDKDANQREMIIQYLTKKRFITVELNYCPKPTILKKYWVKFSRSDNSVQIFRESIHNINDAFMKAFMKYINTLNYNNK